MALMKYQKPRGLQRREQQWSPLQELSRIRNELDRLFAAPFSNLPTGAELFDQWGPPVDILETKDTVVVKAELPGMKKEEIDVSLQKNSLVIAGERKEEKEQKSGEGYQSERFFGRFQRIIDLPSQVDANKIDASYKDGILKVSLPKSEESKPKQIKIKVD